MDFCVSCPSVSSVLEDMRAGDLFISQYLGDQSARCLSANMGDAGLFLGSLDSLEGDRAGPADSLTDFLPEPVCSLPEQTELDARMRETFEAVGPAATVNDDHEATRPLPGQLFKALGSIYDSDDPDQGDLDLDQGDLDQGDLQAPLTDDLPSASAAAVSIKKKTASNKQKSRLSRKGTKESRRQNPSKRLGVVPTIDGNKVHAGDGGGGSGKRSNVDNTHHFIRLLWPGGKLNKELQGRVEVERMEDSELAFLREVGSCFNFNVGGGLTDEDAKKNANFVVKWMTARIKKGKIGRDFKCFSTKALRNGVVGDDSRGWFKDSTKWEYSQEKRDEWINNRAKWYENRMSRAGRGE